MITDWSWLTDYIPESKAEAISAEELAKLLLIDRRELRRSVESARRAGILICGDDSGYYFAVSRDELSAYVHRVRGRIKTASVCLAPFVRKIKEMERGGIHD